MRASWKLTVLRVFALASLVIVAAVVAARVLKPKVSHRRRAVPAAPSTNTGPAPQPQQTQVNALSAAAPAMARASRDGATTAEQADDGWPRLAAVGGAAVVALLLLILAPIVGRPGQGAEQPELSASVVSADDGQAILVKGSNFPAGDDVEVSLEDVDDAIAVVKASPSGDFIARLNVPEGRDARVLKVLAATARTTFRAPNFPSGSLWWKLFPRGNATSTPPRPSATVSISGKTPTVTPTRRAASPTSRPSVTAAAPTKTKTPVLSFTATKTAARLATRTATKAAATATATRTVVATATVKPASATPTRTASATPQTGPTTTSEIVAFGETVTNGFDDDSNWLHINGTHVDVPADGQLKSLAVFVGDDPGGKVRLALYRDDRGEPGQLVAQTREGAAKEGWNELPVLNAPSLESGEYWITAQTNHRDTVYRIAPDGTGDALGWAPYEYGTFPPEVNTWHSVEDMSFSMRGTISTVDGEEVFTPTPISGGSLITTPTPTLASDVQSTPEPSMGIPTNTTMVPISPTPTRTFTATATATTASVPTSTPGGGGAGCVTNCGTPRFFCDTGSWAFCDDYRNLYCPVPPPWDQTDPACAFPDQSRVGVVSADVFSSSAPNYITDEDGVAQRQGFFFNQQEHFHTMVRDGNFGIAVTRHHQPVDLGSERHIHLEVDLKTSARRYVRFTLSPDLTKAIVDDRNGDARPANGLDIWIRNGTFVGNLYKNGSPDCAGGCGNLFSFGTYHGTDNVRDIIDLYVSQNRVRVVVNGVERANKSFSGGLGFNQAYLYLSQVSYNPCKDGECSQAEQIFHWDNVAFDGPVLPRNGLTPSGQQDVMFNAFRANNCTVKGVAAVPVGGSTTGPVWVTWVARMPVQNVSVNDIQCNYAHDNNHSKMAFEVVKR